MNADSQDLSSWQRLWYICAGAAAVLVITSINQFPSLSSYRMSFAGWFFNPLYSGWLWALIAHEAICVGSGLFLLVQAYRQKVLSRIQTNQAFGFLLLGWISAVGFFVRLNGEIPILLLWVSLISMVGMGILYWFMRHRIDIQEELFP
jgi:hypothetical protein